MAYGQPGYPYPGAPMGNTYLPQQRQQLDLNFQMPSQPQQNPVQPGYIVRPVASLEEAKAVPTDFSGAVTVMTDFSHGMIYTKALNYQDGTSNFNCYRLDNSPLQPVPQMVQPVGDFVTRQEMDSFRTEIAQMMQGVMRHDEPDADVPTGRRSGK